MKCFRCNAPRESSIHAIDSRNREIRKAAHPFEPPHMVNPQKMLIEEMASRCALEFFTRAPHYRSRRQLFIDVQDTMRELIIRAWYEGAYFDFCACGEEFPEWFPNLGDRQAWFEKHLGHKDKRGVDDNARRSTTTTSTKH